MKTLKYRNKLYTACQDLLDNSDMMEVLEVLCDVLIYNNKTDANVVQYCQMYKKMIADSRKFTPVLKTKGKKLTARSKRL